MSALDPLETLYELPQGVELPLSPPLASLYGRLLFPMRPGRPSVIVTASGAIDLNLRVFQSGEVPALVVTTQEGAPRIREHALPRLVQVEAMQLAGSISAREVLKAVSAVRQSDLILVEGGPQLMG